MTVPRLSSSDKVTDPMLQVHISDQFDTNQLPKQIDFSIGNMKMKALHAYDNYSSLSTCVSVSNTCMHG